MKRNIHIEALNQIPLEKQRNELVERKCLGHPDSMADGIAESISQALCRTYLDEFGVVLHHNTDQGEVVAGESSPRFGGGRSLLCMTPLPRAMGMPSAQWPKVPHTFTHSGWTSSVTRNRPV